MIHREIDIRGWLVDVFIKDNADDGFDEIVDCLVGIGADSRIVERAVELMGDGIPNEAFTFSSGTHTCIYIGETTDGGEFVNSVVHEIRHLVDHIANHYGIRNEESVGYLSGDAAYLLAVDICEMGCRHCRDGNNNTNNIGENKNG